MASTTMIILTGYSSARDPFEHSWAIIAAPSVEAGRNRGGPDVRYNAAGFAVSKVQNDNDAT